MLASSNHNSRRYFGGGALVGLALFLAGPGAACEVVIRQEPMPVLLDYNPFAPVLARAMLGMEFENRAETDCALELAFLDQNNLPAPDFELGGVKVGFLPRESSGIRRTELTTNTYQLSVPAKSTVRAEFDAAVLENRVIDPGRYSIELRIRVQEPQAQPLFSIPVSLVLTSAPRAQLNIAGAAGAFGSGSSVETVDFGEAETGAVRRAFLQVRANAISTVAFESENHGRLAHVELGRNASAIRYHMDVDGERVLLDERATVQVDPPRTLEGVSLPLTFTLGPIGGVMSGRYRDLITVTINPN
jgi:hypothetical protein